MKKNIQGLAILFLLPLFIHCSSEGEGPNPKISALTGTWELTRYQSDQISTTYKSHGQTQKIQQSFKAQKLDYQIIFGVNGKVYSRGSFQLLNTYKLNGKSIKRIIPISPSSLGRGLFSGTYHKGDTNLVIQNQEHGTLKKFEVSSATRDEILLQSKVEGSPFLDLINNPISLEDQEVNGNIHIILERVE